MSTEICLYSTEHDVYRYYVFFFVQNALSEPICLQGSRFPKFPLQNFWTGIEEIVTGARRKIYLQSQFRFLDLTAVGSTGKETLDYFSRTSILSLILARTHPNLKVEAFGVVEMQGIM